MGAGVPFNEDDKPTFNDFALPPVCATDPEECCDPCGDLLQCLARSPIELNLPGFDLSRWLPCVSFSCDKILQSSGIGGTLDGGGEENVFNGVYLAMSANETMIGPNCGVRGETTLCQDSWEDDGTGGNIPLTHTVEQGRTIYAPGAGDDPEDQTKRIKLALRTECVLNDEDVKCVKFTVVLYFEFARVIFACIEGCEVEGLPLCDPGVLAIIEAASAWAGVPIDCYEVGCCIVAESDLIPIEGLTLADLDNVELHEVPPADWELVDEMEPDGPWQLAAGSPSQCGADDLGFIKAVPYQNYQAPGTCSPEVEAECGVGAFVGHHETGNVGCPHPAEDGATVWVERNQAPDCLPLHVWVPPPITMNAGPAFLKVLATSCRPGDNCGSCVPDPEKPNVSVPVEFSVDVVGAGCYKTYTPTITACVDVVKIYWPWGVATTDLDPIGHLLQNRDSSSATNQREDGTVLLLDARGCIYCAEVTASCNCCEVTGNLDVAVDPDGCGVTVTASTSEGCDGAIPVVEVQFYSGPNGFNGDCYCDPDDETEEPCLSSRLFLADGQSTTVTGIFHGLRWRVWDKVCGCPGPWTEVPGEINCPTVTVFESHETLNPNVEYSEDCGWSELVRFTWTAEWPAWYCGQRVTLAWNHTGYSEGCAEGTIINPGDPVEDQIARHIFTEDVLQKRYAHTIKFWLIGPGFICEGPCFPFPECTALNPDFDSGEACEAVGLPVCATS